MPTGYTCDIAKGISFKKFVMQCARAFGACVEMRDYPHDAEIPEEFKPSDYHLKEANRCMAELAELKDMTPEQAELRAMSDYNHAEDSRVKTIQERNDLRLKYETMFRRVRDWTPPTDDHIELQNFMSQQIRDSIKWDCDTSYYETPTTAMGGAKWLINRSTELTKSIVYHQEEYAKEVARAESRTAWIKALRESLKED